MSDIDSYVAVISDAIVELGVNITHDVIDDVIKRFRLSPTQAEYIELIAKVTANLTGYGELEKLITSDTTDILINSPKDVWKQDQFGLRLTNVSFPSELHVRRLASRLALAGKQRLDEAMPFVDALLPDGARLHAVIPPLALANTAISLRFPKTQGIDIQDWKNDSDLSDRCLDLLDDVVSGVKSGIVCGTTGAGKTALLRSILTKRPTKHRVIIIEDVAELNIKRANTVHLQARQPNTEGIGFVSSQTLVRQSLRMRPDSIVIGEIRGGEIIDFLLAISSGHAGSISTIHAHDTLTLKNRISLLAQIAGFSRSFALDLFNESIDVVIHVENRLGKRIISEVVANRE